ncbi:4-alpha-glucanotransferase [Citreimonas salinaria]|uniref:4-alpha-glucanotransferase n=1 Tax=Citreimonas salinaria TaxID=321339 RepID=A0A1H3F3F0_9RHOB|nr:4-alpha-glucanotransferase [Citreimonas salinaria]SDX85501.1 4-alpha-glucanotransferase [Citreimonas salinaria]
MTDPLAALAKEAGIVPSYTDQTGRRRRTGRATMRALLAAMGLPTQTDADAAGHLQALRDEQAARVVPEWIVVTPDRTPKPGLPDDAEWHLTFEDGSTAEGQGDAALPKVPLGLHRLHSGGQDCTLIAAPPRLPDPERDWGLMLPLHALRPPETGGLADYDDLRVAGEGLAAHGAGFLGLNPIHAGFLADPTNFSPYTPSHRRRLSVFHVSVEDTPAPSGPLVDYATEIPARRAALRRAFDAFRAAGGATDFDAFRSAEGGALERFALHQALSDLHGAYWTDWPEALRDAESAETRAAARDLADEVTFHAWAQWRAHEGLQQANEAMRAAGMSHGLYLDLAVGTHPAGAETWEDRDSFGYGVSLGAPPDAFSADGQSWGLAPFNPRALVAKGFAPLAETLRTQLQLSGALRIDHILGFDRAFWVPEGDAPGAYVQMPRAAMLAVVRLEAARAGAFIVGEDLGNIPPGLRGALDASGILGCRLQLFERENDTTFTRPEDFDRTAIASFSTHDLPTWAGWRKGCEIEARRDLGHISEDFARGELARRQDEVAGFDAMTEAHRPPDTPPDSPDAMHHALAATRSALALVQIECVLGIEVQPNLPGTVDEYPNWRQRLPLAPHDLKTDPRLARAAAIMRAHDR